MVTAEPMVTIPLSEYEGMRRRLEPITVRPGDHIRFESQPDLQAGNGVAISRDGGDSPDPVQEAIYYQLRLLTIHATTMEARLIPELLAGLETLHRLFGGASPKPLKVPACDCQLCREGRVRKAQIDRVARDTASRAFGIPVPASPRPA